MPDGRAESDALAGLPQNDQAWVEQKNGAIVRRLVGYRRSEGVLAGKALAGCMRLQPRGVGAWTSAQGSRIPARCNSARDADGLCVADHAVEHLDSQGDLATLTGATAGSELGPDQVLIAAHGGSGVVALAIPSRALPAMRPRSAMT